MLTDSVASRPLASEFLEQESVSLPVPRRRVISCKEWEDLQLDAAELQVAGKLQVYGHISTSKYLSVKINGGKIVFTATHFIGHIPLNDHVLLDVSPRFDVSNLTRVIRIAHQSHIPVEQFVRNYIVQHEPLPSIFDELTAAFVRSVEVVAQRGLLTSYTERTGASSFPRGRILLDLTIRRHSANKRSGRAESVWFEPTVDNAPNRLLKYTMWVVSRRMAAATPRKGVAKLNSKLNQYYRLFSKVRLDRSRQFLSDSDVLFPQRLPSSRAYYLQAIQLAFLLIQDNSLDLGKRGGTVSAPSMLIDLQDAFEAYLRNCLSQELTAAGSLLRVLDGNQSKPSGGKKDLFDEDGSRPATPDIVICLTDQPGASVIIEVKYKGRPSRDDLNQAIAYGTSYRCRSVILAHAREQGSDPHLQLEGTIGSMKLYRYAYDLAGDLEAEEKIFSNNVARLAVAN